MRPGLIYTLIFIKENSNILLGLKKRGLGETKWNGFGGKVEANETILEGAVRETKEESNLDIEDLNHIGVLTCEKKREKIDIVHIFTTNNYSGDLQETEEMKPRWFNISEIPYDQMWPESKFWVPLVLKDTFFHAHKICNDEYNCNSCVVEIFNSLNDVIKSVEDIITKTM